MRFVIQRVLRARVSVAGEEIGAIGRGFLVLIGIAQGDDERIADLMIRKLLGMRIFADEAGKTNLSLADVGGELLLISQFTLYADCRKGNRPSFTQAAAAADAKACYDYIVSSCRAQLGHVETGSFGADMQVELINDGPFTVLLDSDQLLDRDSSK